jgi:GAF domain-containing protein
MGDRIEIIRRRTLYAVFGFIMGVSAPLIWILIRLIFFPNPEQTIWVQIISDITKDSYNLALYGYMGFGTAVTMSTLGYFIGRATDELYQRTIELNAIHHDVAAQKEIFETQYKRLSTNIKSIHQINSRIQKSLDVQQVLSLCSEGLHDILGYERVNILMANSMRSHLYFFSAKGDDKGDSKGVTLPLDERGGVIFKCFNEKRLFLIDDIRKYPLDYQVQSPYDSIKQIRSRSFMLCPIVVKGESIGLFGIDNKFSQQALDETDLDTLKLFADQVALSITRINLLHAIDTLTTELEKTSLELLQNRESYYRHVLDLQTSVDSLTEKYCQYRVCIGRRHGIGG